MPITSELQNTRELREAGFSQQQAEKLAELFERSQAQGFEKFAEVLQRELGEVRSELREEIKDLRIELHQTLRDQLLKIVGVMVGVGGLAVAIIKLFPNLY